MNKFDNLQLGQNIEKSQIEQIEQLANGLRKN
jgi:hypothetical protein